MLRTSAFINRTLTTLRVSTRTFASTRFFRTEEPSIVASTIKSSCPAGTSLNLHVRKTKVEPVALEDAEYPEWLWTILDEDVQRAKLEADPVKKMRNDMRKRNRQKIKAANFLSKMK